MVRDVKPDRIKISQYAPKIGKLLIHVNLIDFFILETPGPGSY